MLVRTVILMVIAAAFALAGVLKAVTPQHASGVLLYLFPPLSSTPAVADAAVATLAGLEVSVAILVVVGPHRLLGLWMATVMLALFTVVLGILAASSGAPSCGCFGVPKAEPRSEAAAGILRNLGLISFAGWSIIKERASTDRRREASPAIGSVLRRDAGGFTLLEMLAVIVVVSLLIALALPALSRTLENSRLARNLETGRQLNTALAMYTADHHERFPFFGTPKKPYDPIRIRDFEIDGPFFLTQRWYWTSVVVPDYFGAHRSAIEPPGRAEYLRDYRGYPEFIISSHYQITSTVFARPAFWRDDDAVGQPLHLLQHVHPTFQAHLRYPSNKGLLVFDLGGPTGVPRSEFTPVGLGDLSARLVAWKRLDPALAVQRPWGAAGMNIESTRNGLSGADF